MAKRVKAFDASGNKYIQDLIKEGKITFLTEDEKEKMNRASRIKDEVMDKIHCENIRAKIWLRTL